MPTAKGMWFFLRGLFGGKKVRLKSLPRLLYPEAFVDSMGGELSSHLEVRLGNPPKLRTVLGQLHAVMRHSTESRLSQIQTPTLLVRPGMDILIRPTQTDRLAARIPNAEVLTALGQSAGCGLRLAMRRGPQRIAVSVLDELTSLDSTVHLALDVGAGEQTAELASPR